MPLFIYSSQLRYGKNLIISGGIKSHHQFYQSCHSLMGCILVLMEACTCPESAFVAGLAVADKGRRVYIIGGRFGLFQEGSMPLHHLHTHSQTYKDLTAEVFELDLGANPLQRLLPLRSHIFKGTAHWRQVSLPAVTEFRG